jgi:hypothetical protein
MPSPREARAIWDYVVIGLATLPPAGVNGSVRVKVKHKIKSDKKSAAGKNGGRTTTQGLDLADITVDLEYPDAPGQHDLVTAEILKFWPPSGPKGIAHGSCDSPLNIRDVEVLDLESPEWNDGKAHVKITLRQWISDAAATGGTGSGTGATSADLAEIRAKIANLEAMLATSRPVTPNSFAEQVQWINELAQLRAEEEALNTATKTATSSEPTKQFAGTTGSTKPVTGKAGVPTGEIQP